MVKRNKRTTIKNGIKFVKPAKGHQNNNKKDMLCTQHRESVAHTRTEITFISVISFQFHILCKCVLALLLWHFAYKFIVRSGRVQPYCIISMYSICAYLDVRFKLCFFFFFLSFALSFFISFRFSLWPISP